MFCNRIAHEKFRINSMQVLTFAFSAIFSSAAAAEITARDLLNQCLSKDTFVHTICNSYVLGLYEGVTMADGATIKAGEIVKARRSGPVNP